MPKFTFVVVTKKINTRYLAVGKVVTNPNPGTVLDNTVTLPERYKYYSSVSILVHAFDV